MGRWVSNDKDLYPPLPDKVQTIRTPTKSVTTGTWYDVPCGPRTCLSVVDTPSPTSRKVRSTWSQDRRLESLNLPVRGNTEGVCGENK